MDRALGYRAKVMPKDLAEGIGRGQRRLASAMTAIQSFSTIQGSRA